MAELLQFALEDQFTCAESSELLKIATAGAVCKNHILLLQENKQTSSIKQRAHIASCRDALRMF